MGAVDETVPVVIAALGIIKRGLDKYMERIPGSVNLSELQKITLLEMAHILTLCRPRGRGYNAHGNFEPK